jgi:2,4-dienoyl-CoA reductase (NADPH2)
MTATGTARDLLFSEFQVGSLTLKNRLVGLPHGTARIQKGVPDDDDVAYWERRAAGGAAMLTVGGSIPHHTSTQFIRWLNEAYNPAAFAQLELRAQAVHRHGACIVTQLVHLGREGIGSDSEFSIVGPSPLRSFRTPTIPHALDRDEVEELIESFVQCSVNLRDLGYDGVELHAAHGYLIAQFLSTDANRREDEYGGDLTGRMRFLEKVIAGVRDRCGAGFLLGVRLSAEEEYPEGMHLADTLAIVGRLADVAPPDYINITHGVRGAYVKDVTQPNGVAVESAAAVKAATSIPVLVGSRIQGTRLAAEILARGAADLVGTARALIADPDWVSKARAGRDTEIRPCIGVNQECRSFPEGILCAVNPRAGRERWFDAQLAEPRRSGLRIVVAGAGPAGLEAARFAAELGARVTLYERASEVGGQVRLAAGVASRVGVLDLIPSLEHEVRRLGVDVRLGMEATLDILITAGADAVIVATGARPESPAYPRGEGACVITAWEVLAGARPGGRRALVVDDGSGFWDAVSAAEALGDAGLEIHLATPATIVGGAIPHESIGPLLRRLGERGVTFHEHSRVTRVEAEAVTLTDVITGRTETVAVDFVAGHAGARASDELVAPLSAAGLTVRTIGDCISPRRISHAMWEADKAVLELTRADATQRQAARAW